MNSTDVDPDPTGAAPVEEDMQTRARPWSRLRRAAREAGPWQLSGLVGTRLFLGLIVLAVLAGPAALVYTLTRPGPTVSAAAVAEDGAGGELERARAQASGSAAQLVHLWLSAGREDADQLARLVSFPPVRLVLPEKRPPAPTSVFVVDAVADNTGVWTVMVAATGGTAGKGAHYRVPVVVSDAGATALTLPGAVSLEPTAAAPAAQRFKALPADHPAAATVTGFTRSLLTGSGDLARWLAPGVTIESVTPAPCVRVEATTSGSAVPADPVGAQQATVLATVTCLGETGTTGSTSQYPLLLRGRDGRWEVAGYGASLDSPSDNTPPPPTPAATPR